MNEKVVAIRPELHNAFCEYKDQVIRLREALVEERAANIRHLNEIGARPIPDDIDRTGDTDYIFPEMAKRELKKEYPEWFQ